MTQPWATARAERYGKTVTKRIILHTLAVDLLQAYAIGRRLYFSPAVEALAILGLRRHSAKQFPIHLMVGADYAPLLNLEHKQRIDNLMTHVLEKSEDRYGNTIRKNVTLTKDFIATIKTYAKANQMNFSVAVETLALIGLGHRTAESLPRMAAHVMEKVISRYFERQTRLSALTLLAAEEANCKADFLVLQTLWREARLDPENFADNMTVSFDPDAQPHAAARELQQEIRLLAQAGGLKRLKESSIPLAESPDKEATDV
jgi:hypothetical protein